MKKFVLFEYHGSYTGGSVAVVSSLKNLVAMVATTTDEPIITAPEQIDRYMMLKVDPYWEGVPETEFISGLKKVCSPDFVEKVVGILVNAKDSGWTGGRGGYPGYCREGEPYVVRVDWLSHFYDLEASEGLYQVWMCDAPANEKIDRVVSDTYHCA